MTMARKTVLKSPEYMRAALPVTMQATGGGRWDVVDKNGNLIGVVLHEDDARTIVNALNNRETEKMP